MVRADVPWRTCGGGESITASVVREIREETGLTVSNLRMCGVVEWETIGERGPVETDRYGRSIPKEAHGSINLEHRTSSSKTIVEAVARLYDRIVNPKLLVRRMYVVASRVVDETTALPQTKPEQLDLFTDYKALEEQRAKEQADAERERKAQEALLAIRQKLGKNANLKGMNLEDGATARDRNRQIGGHKA